MKMKPEVLKALEGSICKWEGICMGHIKDLGYMNCPLCTLFYLIKNCYGCPVSLTTGYICCEETPYHDWDRASNKHQMIMISALQDIHQPYIPMFAEIAEAELIFLLSLLPENHPWREMI